MSLFKPLGIIVNVHLVSLLWVGKYQKYLQKPVDKLSKNKIPYSKLMLPYSITLRHPIPNLGAPIPNLGAPTPNFGASFKMADTGSWRQSLG